MPKPAPMTDTEALTLLRDAWRDIDDADWLMTKLLISPEPDWSKVVPVGQMIFEAVLKLSVINQWHKSGGANGAE